MQQMEQRVLALAGAIQACQQVRNIATKNHCDEDVLSTAVSSIFVLNPQATVDVYGKISHLFDGLRYIKTFSPGQSQEQLELTRIFVLSLSLSKKLLKNPKMLQTLSRGIEQAGQQAEHFGITHINVMSNLADLYKQTISTLSPRIMVPGEPAYLNNSDNIARIRTLLLAAIRSGVLWHQLGGSKWQLLFQRQKIIDAASQVLKNTTI